MSAVLRAFYVPGYSSSSRILQLGVLRAVTTSLHTGGLDRRRAQAAGTGRPGLVGAGPGRRCVTQEAQWGAGTGAELEAPTGRDDQRVARSYWHRWDFLSSGVGWAAPHVAVASQHVPDFLDGAVPHRARHLARGQRHLTQAGARCATPLGRAVDQQANLRAVRRNRVRLPPHPRG